MPATHAPEDVAEAAAPEPKLLANPRSRPTRLGLTTSGWLVMLVVVIGGLVEALPRLGVIDSYSMVPLSEMAIRAGQLMVSPEFLVADFLPSVISIFASFLIAAVTGIIVGFLTWRFQPIRSILDPWLATYYAIPTFALYPLLVVVMGVGQAPIVALGALFAVVAMISATIDGLDAIPQTTLRLSQSLELSVPAQLFKILLPAALPQISVGLRLCMSYSLIMVLASEFVLATRGIGHFISNAYHDFQISDMYAGVLLVFALALLVNFLFARLLGRSRFGGA